MQKSILTILAIIFAACASFGQTVMPPVFEIKTDTAFWQNISTDHYQMLEDKSGKLTIHDVTSLPLSDQFHDRNEKSSNRDTISNTYWFRYRLKNVMSREARIALDSNSDYDDFYLALSDGNWKHYESGLYKDWDKKDGLKYFNCIPIVLHPDEELMVYECIQNKKAGLVSGFGIKITGAKKMIKDENSEVRSRYFNAMNLQEAFVVGLLFLAMFFNLFFFRIVREKVYLYFALYALFLGVNRLTNIFSEFFKVENAENLRYVQYFKLAWVFILFFLIQFFRQFFQTKTRYPRWDKWLKVLTILTVILYLSKFLSGVFSEYPGNFILILVSINSFIFIPLSIIVTLLYFARNPDKSIRFVIIGSFPLMLFYLTGFRVEIANILHTTANLSLFYKIFHHNFRLLEISCLTWFILSFSWILFMRYDRLIKENAQHALDKEKLAKEKEIEKNELIAKQKADLEDQVAERTADLKQSLENLKSTQTQLIQSEKMASLGELTAGIAHEIQNPLNFINNFSEVNSELIGEMEEEIEKGNFDDAREIAKAIRENQQKINHHGKRADRVVKGMLQHSRTSTGQKEPTDINALADEYLRLAYHGLRAKDKSFNAKFETDFDQSTGKIAVVQEEMGRIILNLINNAFYAVDEKRKLLAKDLQGFQNLEGLDVYEPTVSVSTKRMGEKVLISVKDNGNGIPPKVLDKIFQPFFTTKPTGQGTGLGLSMSYDIVKAHGGDIKVESVEGQGTEFIVIIPLIS
jgi:signal transduction histidine kinase